MTSEAQSQAEAERGAQPDAASWRRFVAPSIGDVVFITIFSLALALGANLTHRDGDLGRHIRLGRAILDGGTIPHVDVYSHTMAGGEMVPHEWLSQAVLAGVETWFGFDGIGILIALLAALPWMLMYRWLVRRGTSVPVAVVLSLVGAAASMVHWAARPHAFTWLFVVLWVLLLEDLRRGHRNRVWILLPITVVWANTHGAFIVGFILVGTYLVGAVIDRWRGTEGNAADERLRHLLLMLIGTVLVSTINPAGFKSIINGFAYVGEDFLLQFTREYNSPDFHSLFFWPFLVMILGSILISVRWKPTSLLLAASWTAFALYSFRNIPLYALVMTPILASAIESRRITSDRGVKRFDDYFRIEEELVGGSLAVVFVALMVFAMVRSPDSDFDFNSGLFPIDAIETVGQSPPGARVFNEFRWGGYLEYCCHPEIPVFIDGQTDYYGAELTREYDTAIRAQPGWREVFAGHAVDWVLIAPDSPLAQVLVEADDWSELYRDGTAVVFVPS